MTKEIIQAALKAAFEAHVSLLFQNLCSGLADEAAGNGQVAAPDARQRFNNGFDIACLAYEEMMQRPA